jgi:hypothetical protein
MGGLIMIEAGRGKLSSDVHTTYLIVLSIAFVTVLASIFVHLFIRQRFLDNMDERNYLWLADRILEGQFTSEPPVPEELSQHFEVMWRSNHNARQYTAFPVGWPALLAIGRAFSVPWIVNPILAGFIVVLSYFIANTLYEDQNVAKRVVLLLAFCPFLVFQAGTMLSHVSTLFWILLGILAVVQGAKKNRDIFVFLAGISFGFGFTTRPLDALAIGIPTVIWLIVHNRKMKIKLMQQILLMIVGGALGLIPFWLYNKAVTGSALFTPQQLYGIPDHLFAESFYEWYTETLKRTMLQIRDWQEWFLPAGIVVLFSFILLARVFNANDFFWISTIGILLTAYSFNVSYFDICGPRYHLFVIVPTSIVIARLFSSWKPREVFVALLVVLIYYLVLIGYQGNMMWKDIQEKRALELCIKSKKINRALIFIPENKWFTPMANQDQLNNNPDFSGVIYAFDIPETNDNVLSYFPDVPAYKWESRNQLIRLSRNQ